MSCFQVAVLASGSKGNATVMRWIPQGIPSGVRIIHLVM